MGVSLTRGQQEMKDTLLASLRRYFFGLNESEKIQLKILQLVLDNPGKNLVLTNNGIAMMTDVEFKEYERNKQNADK